jgi:hypothetical protein
MVLYLFATDFSILSVELSLWVALFESSITMLVQSLFDEVERIINLKKAPIK